MPSTPLLLDQLRRDYPDLEFAAGDHFEWQPSSKTILYDPTDNAHDAHLLHELAHALLEHSDYRRDIELIGMERDAWQMARKPLADTYQVHIDESQIQDDLDTYREWLHARSTCPQCQSHGLQTERFSYTCVTCRHVWRVNEARTCQLRRYSVDTQ